MPKNGDKTLSSGARNQDRKLLKRVREMEERYDALARALSGLGEAVSGYEGVKPDLAVLRDYLESGQWKKDFEADEKGRIPAEVKRGVLSEDGLYNLLHDADELLERAREVLAPDEK